MTEETSKHTTAELSGLTLQGVSQIKASLTEDGRIPEALILGLGSNDLQVRRTAITKIRKIQTVQPVLDAGLVPTVVGLLDSEDTTLQASFCSPPDLVQVASRLQFSAFPKCQASWMVLNIASGTTQQTACVVQAGAIPKLITLSASPSEDVAYNAVWALANIVGDSPNFRDLVEGGGGIDALVRLLDHSETTPPKVQGRAVWAISNFIKPSPTDDLSVMRVKPLIPCLVRYIQENHADEATSEDDQESIAFAIQSLSWMLDRGLERSDVIETGVVPRLIHFLTDSSSGVAIQKRALRCLAYLTNGGTDDTDALIEAGLLPALLVHVDAKKPEFCRMALWGASNIAVGTQSQAYALVDCGLLKSAARILLDDQNAPNCRREACWMISKLSDKIRGDIKISQAFVDNHCVEGLLVALRIPDVKTRRLAVFGITEVLEYQDSQGSQVGDSFAGIIRASPVPQDLRAIRDSRGSDDENLRNDCHTLLTRYFPEYSKRARV